MTDAGEFTAATYNRLLAERKIMGSRCGGCGELHVPPRPICSACHGSDMGWAQLSGTGRVTGLTSVAIVPSAMAERGFGRGNPYVTAIVRLDDGPSVAARIEGVDTAARPGTEVSVGAAVVADFLEEAHGQETRTLLVFRPASS